jgi:hypothetical protein
MRTLHWAVLLFVLPLFAGVPQPAGWVPARWPWSDPKSLELLAESPINCLLVNGYTSAFTSAAAERGVATLAVIKPGEEAGAAVRRALAAGVTGIVLEGSFPGDAVAAAKQAAGPAPLIELAPRGRMKLDSGAAILGTYQGVWPGIAVEQDGATKAGPTGSVWIDTNTGFIRAVRAWGGFGLWIANEPPPKTVVTGARYLQAIADAETSGARWVVALDGDFAARLERREAGVLGDWRRMNELLAWFERHPEWRGMGEFGQLAVVQDPARGGLLSGGILDMIAVRHTPVRPVPRERLTPESLRGATMAVNADPAALTPAQRDVLRDFTRSGGTLLTGPPGWKDEAPRGDRITLDGAQLERLNDIWRDVNSMVGRRNLGVRLFNVASMLSNVLISADGKTEIVHLVNYSDYPVENVALQFLGEYRRATLLTPDGAEKPLEIYPADEGRGVDIPKVAVCATVRLEQ